MVNAVEVGQAHGLVNVEDAVRAATQVGLPIEAAFAMLSKESGGRNIWGSDVGGTFSGRKGDVTEADYKIFIAKVRSGARSNGVGPAQLTYPAFFDDAEKQGLRPWVPLDNMIYGMRLLTQYAKKYNNDWAKVGTMYNHGNLNSGITSYGKSFAALVSEWKTRLEGADEEETPVASWFLAPSLDVLRDEINAKWPNRSKASDGTLGDASHAARASEHNPNRDSSDDVPDGAVTAMDITATDIKIRTALLDKLVGDKRVWYVINKGKIWSRTHDWEERAYDGSNPHTSHIHVSLRQTKTAVNDKSTWGIKASATPAPTPTPTVPANPSLDVKYAPSLVAFSRSELVPSLKRALNLVGVFPKPDGPAYTNNYDQAVANAVNDWHHSDAGRKFTSGGFDGQIGPKGFAALMAQAKAKKA